ncbi:MAG: hypothetical protein RL381_538 [Actinomycetota bacterium]|jgi:hypothetical protein
MGLAIKVTKSRATQVISRFITEERGSLSILILSLFMTILITLLILTDISSIYFAKRSLTQATEAAAQRGVRNLDLEKYYKSKYNFTKMILNMTDAREKDPGIPIDCYKGRDDAFSTIAEFSRNRESLLGPQLGEIQIQEVQCDGYQLSLRTSATARLPFVIPFTGIEKVEISSQVGTFDERKITTNYYGINIG